MSLSITTSTTPPTPTLHRTRFVLISDTHNHTFPLPAGDVLIHAGDLTNQGTLPELTKTTNWLDSLPGYEAKIVIAGNHDITLSPSFYAEHGLAFHNQAPQSPTACRAVLSAASSLTYLQHEATTITLTRAKGPRTRFSLFGSPYVPQTGRWAFGYKSPDEARELWGGIPLGTDIVVTHGPAKWHLDAADGGAGKGCEALREALWRVRPRLSICGHIHEGRGVQVVDWDLGCANVKFKETETRTIQGVKGGKNGMYEKFDFTTRGLGLDNDGRVGSESMETKVMDQRQRQALEEQAGHQPVVGSVLSPSPTVSYTPSSTADSATPGAIYLAPLRPDLSPPRSPKTLPSPGEAPAVEPCFSTIGQGGYPSNRCDMAALEGRMGRRQTVLVNASMMKTSWPHKGRYNGAVVVDLDLPVSEEHVGA